MLLPKVARKTPPALFKLRHHWVLLGGDWHSGMVAGGPIRCAVPDPPTDPQWFCIWLAASAATVTTFTFVRTVPNDDNGSEVVSPQGARSRQESESEHGFGVQPTYKHLLH